MKSVIFGFLLLFSLIGSVSLSGDQKRSPKGAEREGWALTFFDEFDGGKLDYDKWMPKDPWGVERNGELQGYWLKAFHLSDGILKIRCEDTPTFYDGQKREYRSGMMTTHGKFSQKYGRFEIRCKVPAGQGLWPAFWMLADKPLSWPPEIDILEILGEDPDRIYLSHHWVNPEDPKGDSESITAEIDGPDFSKEFHTFALEWQKDEMRWYIDGIEKHSTTDEIPHRPMFLLANLAVGGWAKEPDGNTPFPSDFEIDHIRVWTKK